MKTILQNFKVIFLWCPMLEKEVIDSLLVRLTDVDVNCCKMAFRKK